MTQHPVIHQFIDHLRTALTNGSFIKVSLGNYKGNEEQLKNIYVRLVEIKRMRRLSFTFRFQTRDVVKNFTFEEGFEQIAGNMTTGFRVANLFTVENDLTLSSLDEARYSLKRKPATLKGLNNMQHNKEKKRLVLATAEKVYLQELKITDAAGVVYKNAQEKYKQINQYIALLSPMLKELVSDAAMEVVDMGSGKGYLTFALYDYLQSVLKVDAHVTGVEFRRDLVDLCNGIARASNFDRLEFVEGSIQDFNKERIDLLIALHACDTATDDAIYKGVLAGAKLIVVAPCCHKQIRREMTLGMKANELSVLTQHGIFLERQAEMVTDAIRSLILEFHGYKTKVMEFNADVHTPKNVLLVGMKQSVSNEEQGVLLTKLRDLKAYFGIRQHYLEKLFELTA